MSTEVIQADMGCAEVAAKAAKVLSEGGLVCFPTETVYGIAARADHARAVTRLREVKERRLGRAFTVHLGAKGEVERYATDISALGRRLIRKGWPGPVTLILSAAPSAEAFPGDDTRVSMYHKGSIGLRCPDDRVAEAVLRAVGAPVVAASANRAGKSAPVSAEDALRGLNGQVDLLIDAGRTRYGRPSTIVRVKDRSYEILREGVYEARTIARLSRLVLLFVCTGNTCRSPMVAGIAKKLAAQYLQCRVEELGNHGVVILSAGIAGGAGGASEHAVSVMARRGTDISRHRSVRLSRDTVQEADFLFTMAQSHRDAVVAFDGSAADRVSLLLPDGLNVEDPIGGSEDDYERCAQVMERAVEARLKEVLG